MKRGKFMLFNRKGLKNCKCFLSKPERQRERDSERERNRQTDRNRLKNCVMFFRLAREREKQTDRQKQT